MPRRTSRRFRCKGFDHGNRQWVSMILIRQKDRCLYCQKKIWVKPDKKLGRRKATLDHRVPIALGGEPYGTNAVVACLECNMRKGTLSAAVYMMTRHNDQILKRAHRAVGIILRERSEQEQWRIRYALKDVVYRSKRELFESLQPVIEEFRKNRADVAHGDAEPT